MQTPITQPNSVAPPQGQIDPVQNLLSQMHDIATPDPIGIWPPAIGWWLLLILVLFSLGLSLRLLQQRYKNTRYRKAALAALEVLEKNTELSHERLLKEGSILIKQTLLHAAPHCRKEIANIYGKRWYKFLNNLVKNTLVSEENMTQWSDATYSSAIIIDRPAYLSFCRRWIKQHSKLTDKTIYTAIENIEEPGHV